MGYKVAVVGATGAVGARAAQHPGRARLPGRRGGGAGLARLRGQGGLLRRRARAQGAGARDLRLRGHRHRAVLARGRGLQGARAARRRGRLRRDRQHLAVPDGPAGAAGRARGQPRGARALPREEHRRQPELLDDPDGDGAEAAARPRGGQARGGRDLSVGLGRGPRGDGRIVRPDQGHLRDPVAPAQACSRSRSPST